MSTHQRKDRGENASHVACTPDLRSSTANGCPVKHLNLALTDLGSSKHSGLASCFIGEVSIQTSHTHTHTHWVMAIRGRAHPATK